MENLTEQSPVKKIEEETAQRYAERFAQHGYSPLTLGWNKGKQFERFHQLTGEWPLHGASILDVGCGFGDFLRYLDKMQVSDFQYTGIDVTPDLIETANTNNKRPNASFLTGNFLHNHFENNSFDYCFASGVFNFRYPDIDQYDYLQTGMQRMYNLCNTAFAIDMISDKVDYQLEHTVHYSPSRVLDMAYGFSRNVLLKNNYFPFEFAIIVFKDDRFPKETTMFNTTEKRLAFLKD